MARLTQHAQAAVRQATEIAQVRNGRAADSEHILLALTKLYEEGTASARVLSGLGITEVLMLNTMDGFAAPGGGGAGGSDAHSITHIVTHTRWLARYFRETRADREHLLLGALWHEPPENKVLRELRLQEVTFEAAYQRLTGQVTPPELERSQPVYVPRDALERVLRVLPTFLPADASYSFNFDEELAWLGTSDQVDLEGCVQRALEETEGE